MTETATNQRLSGDPFEPLDGPELVIALVGPVGADLELVCNVLTDELAKAQYNSKEIRVSTLLHQLEKYSHLSTTHDASEYERIRNHMKSGTELRQIVERGDIMALLAVSEIRRQRQLENAEKHPEIEESERPKIPLKRTAYILRSLKHPDEIGTLRHVYGRAFFVISVYSPRENRVDALAQLIARSRQKSDANSFRKEAEELIGIDEAEEGNKLGQNVSDAFPLGDFFLDARSKERIEQSVARFVDLLFGHPYHTPLKDEFAMFHAKSAAMRSADLSRQVGAVITTDDGDVIALGCNEVPKAGGGLYWCSDESDNRDFRRGHDSGARFKRDILAEVLRRLSDGNWLAEKKMERGVKALVDDLLTGESQGILQDAHVTNLIEFGRAVHAEMAALSDAARRGNAVKGGTLYTTTFPCHLCARHIIAAGIKRVVYIEPYPKSLAKELYDDSLVIDPQYQVKNRVHFEPFVGIAPIRYMHFFEAKGKRKSPEGDVVDWDRGKSNPTLKRFVLSYIFIEDRVVGEVIPFELQSKNLVITGGQ